MIWHTTCVFATWLDGRLSNLSLRLAWYIKNWLIATVLGKPDGMVCGFSSKKLCSTLNKILLFMPTRPTNSLYSSSLKISVQHYIFQYFLYHPTIFLWSIISRCSSNSTPNFSVYITIYLSIGDGTRTNEAFTIIVADKSSSSQQAISSLNRDGPQQMLSFKPVHFAHWYLY